MNSVAATACTARCCTRPGHFLGLEHLPAPAVMAAETSTCLDALTDADLEALFARYGPVAQPAE